MVDWLHPRLMAVPIVLSAVGFMEFRTGDFDVNPTLGIGSTLFTAITTLGLAMIFGRSRARDFIELEIEEGVRKTTTKAEPKRWLHWSAFLFGMLAVIDTWLEMNGSEDGIVSNFFIEGLIGIIGPFALWIGGALLLGRIGAKGPQIMQLLFGRTPLLKDVKRGLKGSGSAESVNRLAVIMLLTLSIVTLAAVQGYTGTLVDEKTADATVGSDLQISTEQSMNSTELISLVNEFTQNGVNPLATSVPEITLADEEGGDNLQTFVLLNGNEEVLRWSEQSIPGDDVDAAMRGYRNNGFSAGQDSAYTLDLTRFRPRWKGEQVWMMSCLSQMMSNPKTSPLFGKKSNSTSHQAARTCRMFLPSLKPTSYAWKATGLVSIFPIRISTNVI